jgi:aminoglycoside phosphotransferase (APT) family kinase protein
MLVITWVAMARTLLRLHRVPGQEVARALAESGIAPERLELDTALDLLTEWIEPAGQPRCAGHARVLEWLRQHRPEPAASPTVCHGDFWIGNLMLSPRRIALLDWTQAGVGHAEFDLGWMSIQHYSRMPLELPDPAFDWLWLPVRPFTWLLMAPTRFVYRLGARVDAQRLRYYTVFWALRVLASGARLARSEAADARPAELRAWGSAHTVALLRHRVRRITGLDPGANATS